MKTTLRTDSLLKLKKMTPDEYIEKSDRILSRLLETPEFQHAETVAVTISRKTEVETRTIIEACWAAGKKVAVPKCDPKEKTMDFREITSFDQLESVYLDLQEPDPLSTLSVKKDAIDLLIVPGVVFAADGYRIGYGGGYYDRYLEDYPNAVVSLAFELQVVDRVPRESHDLPVGKIITEERVMQCHKQS